MDLNIPILSSRKKHVVTANIMTYLELAEDLEKRGKISRKDLGKVFFGRSGKKDLII